MNPECFVVLVEGGRMFLAPGFIGHGPFKRRDITSRLSRAEMFATKEAAETTAKAEGGTVVVVTAAVL